MTPQELAALPKGTRIRFDLSDVGSTYDLGTIEQAGASVAIKWDEGIGTYIDTKSGYWDKFVSDISLDTPPESV